MTMTIINKLILTLTSFCALHSGAQTHTSEYLALADSAYQHLNHSRWQEAERCIVEALRLEPGNKSNFMLWSNLGKARTEMERYTEAIEAYDIGLALAPRSSVMLTGRAYTHLRAGDTTSALIDIDSALSIDSTLQWPRKIRGILLVSIEEYDRASADLNYYTSQWGEDSDVSEALGDIAVKKGDYSEAISQYKKSYQIGNEYDRLLKMLVTAYYAGKIEDMEEEIREGIKKYPRQGELFLMRAMLDKSRYQTEQMEQNLKIARQLGVDDQLYRQMVSK